MKALIGLCYLAGVLRQNRVRTRDLSDSKLGIPFFRGTMSCNRFNFLTRCLRFDDKKIRLKKLDSDRLYAIREIFDHIVHVSNMLCTPSDCVTVDEHMLGFNGRCR